MKPKLYRQGDILLERIESLPPSAVEEQVAGLIVLAYGEATGHHHAIRSGKVKLFKTESATFIEVQDALVQLTHEEHSPILLEPGFYRMIRQREYTPEKIRIVED
jgi:hypothetical protein